MRISDWSSDVCSSDLGNLSFSRISDRSEWVQLRPQKKRAAPGYPGRPDRNRTWREPSGSFNVRSFLSFELMLPSDARDRKGSSVRRLPRARARLAEVRSEGHTSELQSLMRTSSAVF